VEAVPKERENDRGEGKSENAREPEKPNRTADTPGNPEIEEEKSAARKPNRLDPNSESLVDIERGICRMKISTDKKFYD
jgi:hypothetical protein